MVNLVATLQPSSELFKLSLQLIPKRIYSHSMLGVWIIGTSGIEN